MSVFSLVVDFVSGFFKPVKVAPYGFTPEPSRVSAPAKEVVSLADDAAAVVKKNIPAVLAWVREVESDTERAIRARLVLAAETAADGKNRAGVKAVMESIINR